MIAAPVQCDVDGIPKWSHYVSVPPIKVRLDSAIGRRSVPICPGPQILEAIARLRDGSDVQLPFLCSQSLSRNPDFAYDRTPLHGLKTNELSIAINQPPFNFRSLGRA
jgi:hypothetical protein